MSGEAKYSALQIAEWFLNYNRKQMNELAMGNTG